MTETAYNPQTGERIALVNGQWVPITSTAVNPQTGERLGLAGSEWVPLSTNAAQSGQGPVVTPTWQPWRGPLAEGDAEARAANESVSGLGYLGSIGAGSVGAVRAATDLFGADNPVSGLLRDAEEGIMDTMASSRDREILRARANERAQTLEGKGFFETLGEMPGLLRDDPSLIAQGVGSLLPNLLLGIATGGTSVAAQVGAQAALGAAQGTGTVKGSIYDVTRDELVSAGVSRDAAEAAAVEAQSYAGDNLDMIGFGSVLGAIAGSTGIEAGLARSVAARIVGKGLTQGAITQTTREVLEASARQGFVRGALTEGVTEGAQGAQERLATNLSQRRRGQDVDPMEGVGSAGALEGTIGAIIGSPFSGVQGVRARAQLQNLNEQEAELGRFAEAVTGNRAPDSDEERLQVIGARAAQLAAETGYDLERATTMAEQEQARIEERLARRAAQQAETDNEGQPAAEDTTGEPTDGVAGAGVSSDLGPDVEGTGVAGGPAVGAGVVTPGGMDGVSPPAGVDTGSATAAPPPLIDIKQPLKARNARAMELAEEGVQRPEFKGLGLTSNQRNMAKNMLRNGRFLDEADPVRTAVQTVLNKTQRAAYEAPAPGEIYTVKTAADAYIARQTAQDASDNPQLEQFIANNATEINAEFVRRQQEAAPPPAPEAPPTVADTLTEEKVAVEPVVEPEFENIIAYPELTPEGGKGNMFNGRPMYSQDEATHASRRISRAELEAALKTGVFGLPESGETKHGVGKKWWSPADANGIFGRPWDKGGVGGATVRVPIDKIPTNAPVRIEDVEILDSDIGGFRPLVPAPTPEPAPTPAPVIEEAPAPVAAPVVEEAVVPVAAPTPAPTPAPAPAGPPIQFNETNASRSKSISDDVFGFATEMKNLLVGPDVKVHFTTPQDAVEDVKAYPAGTAENTWLSAIAASSDLGARGGPQTTKNLPLTSQQQQETTFVTIDPSMSKGQIIETLSHELGHDHMYREFNQAPPAIQAAIKNEYIKWLSETKKVKTLGGLMRIQRTPRVAERVIRISGGDDILLANIHTGDLKYILGFNEWYADQVARWAMTSEKPRTITEKFFARVAAVLKRFYESLKGKNYLPNATFAQWMDDTTSTYAAAVTPSEEATVAEEAAPEVEEAPEAEALTYDAVADEIEGAYQSDEAEGKSPEIDEKTYKLLMGAVQAQRGTPEKIMEALETAKDRYAEKAAGYTLSASKKGFDAAQKAEDAVKKVQAAGDQNPEAAIKGIQEAYQTQSTEDWIKTISAINWGGNGDLFRALLASLPSDGLLNYAESKLGTKLTADLRTAMERIARMDADRARMMRKLNKPVRNLRDFTVKFGNDVIAAAMHYSRYTNVDMTKLKSGMTEDEAFATDDPLQWMEKKQATEKAGTREFKKRQKAIDLRKAYIREATKLWNALGEQEGGHANFTATRDMYRNLYQVRRYALETSIKELGVPNAGEILKKMRLDFERVDELLKSPSKEEAHPDFPEVPLGLFPKEYFPFARFGNYYLRVEKGPGGEPATYFFENTNLQQSFLRKLERAGVPEKDITAGLVDGDYNATEELGGSSIFEAAVKIINGIDPEAVTEDTKRKTVEGLYDLYLMTLPEGVRKNFIKSKNRTGYSSDVARVAGVTAMRYANEIANLTHRNGIRAALNSAGAIDAAEDVGTDQRFSLEVRQTLKAFVGEVESRAESEINPDQNNSFLARAGRKLTHLAFISFLTGPATALTQMLSLPIRVQPRLWRDYNFNDVNEMMTKYASGFGATPKLGRSATGTATWYIPSIAESTLVKTNPRLLRAYDMANDEFSLFEPMSSHVMENEPTPQSVTGSKKAMAAEVAGKTLTFLYDSSEKLTREAAFMAAYELEYNKLKKAGGENQTEMERAAVLKARDVVNDTLFDYNSYNRPRFLKGELGKAVFQFKMYVIGTLRFLIENGRTIIYGQRGLDGPTRAQAFKELGGVLMMAGMFGGLVGSPFWTLIALGLKASDWGDDDDDETNPYLRDDPVAWFMYDYLPRTLGGPQVTGMDGENYSLADMALRGPISVFTGMDFGSRVSLDVGSMLFQPPRGETYGEKAVNLIEQNIPGASAGFDILAGIDELQKGNVVDALAKGMPVALLRNPFRAVRFGTEGYASTSGKVGMSADDFSTYQLMGSAFGMNPMELAEEQQRSNWMYETAQGFRDEREALTNKLNRTRRMQRSGSATQEDLAQVITDINQYNTDMRAAGLNHLLISASDVIASLRGLLSEEEGDIGKVSLTPEEGALFRDVFSEE